MEILILAEETILIHEDTKCACIFGGRMRPLAPGRSSADAPGRRSADEPWAQIGE